MQSFGRYLLLRQIAEGGMGELFLAQQHGIAGFAKKLVVKRIKPALADDPQFVEMFLDEGRIAALIDHPNVVHIHELGEIDGRYFIAMEYVPGRSLASVMEEIDGPLELPHALHIMINVCEGLAYAHAATGLDGTPLGLVHRDVSPPNILLGYSGSVKVSDFGIAKVSRHRHTAVGVLKGKFAYLSPEQARGEQIDARSDIYALGLVLYEMTVGKRANAASTDTAMVFAAAQRQIVEPAEILPDYPPALQAIFAKATALDPAARYQQAKELQADLLAFQLDGKLLVAASDFGEWLRSLPGSKPDDEPTESRGEPTAPSAPSTPPPSAPAPAKIAYAPTVQVQAGGGAAFEVDLEKEREEAWKPTTSGEPTGSAARRRSGHGLPLAATLLLLTVFAAGFLLLRSFHGSDPGARADASARPDARGAASQPSSTQRVRDAAVTAAEPAAEDDEPGMAGGRRAGRTEESGRGQPPAASVTLDAGQTAPADGARPVLTPVGQPIDARPAPPVTPKEATP